jgi:RNA methyltransferase, TrmH family
MPKISKNRLKQLAQLKLKKYRDEQNLYVAEGEKMVSELLLSKTEIKTIVANREWLDANHDKFPGNVELLEANEEELKRLSLMPSPNKVLAYSKISETRFDTGGLHKKLTLVLDDIQDPGNLGTIIRLADWFGIENIICSEKSVNLYNPKVVQSTMGAFLKVNVFYLDLDNFFKEIKKMHEKILVYGTFLEGKNIYKTNLSSSGIIVLGNESKGISKSIENYIDEKLTIPSFNTNPNSIDSLNVSVATAIVCSEFRRQSLK